MKQGKEAKPCASRHLRTSVISRNRRSWNQKIKNTKAELYSEVTLLKMIQALMQYSQSKITPARKQSKVDSSIRDASKSRIVESRLEAKSRVQPVQRAVEGNDLQRGKHGVLRDLRDHSQGTVPRLYDILDERHCYCTCGTC